MKENFLSSIETIESLDPVWRQKARVRLSEQTRPQGSLGLLESFVERIVAIQKREKPSIAKKRILIFAADHGVTEEGISLYPRDVTRAMVLNFQRGGATINALARQVGSEICVLDVGVGSGTKNFSREKAMSEEEFWKVFSTGWEEAQKAAEDGIELLGLGEMGIGNTTSASAVVARLTGWEPDFVTGRGTGLSETQRQHKARVIDRALALHRKELMHPFSTVQCVGGFEIAALTGTLLGGAVLGLPMIVDGWIVSAAALVAQHMKAQILDYLFFAHQSEEQGHRRLLEHLEVRPLLNLSMRLGEASGAALAMGILEAAVRVYLETATFAEAGVSRRDA